MYDCRLFNEETKHSITFRVLPNYPDMVLVERYNEKGVLLSTATSNEEADTMKQQFLSEGFGEV